MRHYRCLYPRLPSASSHRASQASLPIDIRSTPSKNRTNGTYQSQKRPLHAGRFHLGTVAIERNQQPPSKEHGHELLFYRGSQRPPDAADVLEVPAGYYAGRERPMSEGATANARLLAEIRRLPRGSSKRYSKSAGPCRGAGAGTRHTPGDAEEDGVSLQGSRRSSRRGSVRAKDVQEPTISLVASGSLDQVQHGRRRRKC
jgi:hypothetical protein